MTQEGETPDLIETGPLPFGFMALGAARGLFKPSGPAHLPSRLWTRTVRLDPDDYGPYARFCGFGPEQGVPMTWPYVLSFPLQMRLMLAQDFPYPAMGMVHLASHIRQESRLHASDTLRLICGTGRFHAHPKGQAFSLDIRAERDGATIWSATSFYLRRGAAGQGADLPSLSRGKLDHKIETIEARLATARRYARLSGDANPIHTSEILARILGFPRPLAHGMWTKARALSALTEGRPVDAASAEVSFKNPLLMPSKAELYAVSSGAVCDFDCRSIDGARTFLLGRLSLL